MQHSLPVNEVDMPKLSAQERGDLVPAKTIAKDPKFNQQPTCWAAQACDGWPADLGHLCV